MTIKKTKELEKLVEKQEEDFTCKTRKLQWQMDLKEKTIDAIKKDLSRK